MKEKIAVALSGGVDSSVVAALLLEQGYEVEGFFMKNWSPEEGQSLSDCPWLEDQSDAEAVCVKLGIPFRSLNFEREYRERVLDYFLHEYSVGRTPNPDVLCNKEIKFGAFLDVVQSYGFARMATGHYAQISQPGSLLRGVDPGKDQSYFLYALSKEQLGASLFPLGELHKSEVRALARKFKLPTSEKKDSQGICFIGKLDIKEFLLGRVPESHGTVYLAGTTQIVGKATAANYYTLGERAGRLVDNRLYTQVTGSQDVPPLFIIKKDGEGNIWVSADSNTPELFSEYIILESWLGAGVPIWKPGLTVQVRYQQKEKISLEKLTIDVLGLVELKVGQPYLKAVACGQSAVIYTEDGEVLGGGIISSTKGPDVN